MRSTAGSIRRAILVAGLMSVALVPVFAQRGNGVPPRDQFGPPPAGRGQFGPPPGGGLALERLDRELGLTDTQKTQIQALLTEQRTAPEADARQSSSRAAAARRRGHADSSRQRADPVAGQRGVDDPSPASTGTRGNRIQDLPAAHREPATEGAGMAGADAAAISADRPLMAMMRAPYPNGLFMRQVNRT